MMSTVAAIFASRVGERTSAMSPAVIVRPELLFAGRVNCSRTPNHTNPSETKIVAEVR